MIQTDDFDASVPEFKVDLFQDFDMHPEDMNFQVAQIPTKLFDTLLEKTASFSPDENPGKTLKLVVKETTTNTIVGFIRYGSPLINSKPRNDYLDRDGFVEDGIAAGTTPDDALYDYLRDTAAQSKSTSGYML